MGLFTMIKLINEWRLVWVLFGVCFASVMILLYRAGEESILRQSLYNKCITEQYEDFTQLAPHQLSQYCHSKSRTLINEKDL
jgi:hypothetical protein